VKNLSYEVETHEAKIEDVKPLEKHLDIIFKVIEKIDEKEINKRTGETHRVCDFTVADETGSITLTVWNEDIDQLEIDQSYKLSNGYVNVFQNSLRLTKGKYGSIAGDSTSFDDVNQENNRSSEHVEDPRRRSYSYSDRRSSRQSYYGSNRSSDRRRDNRGYRKKNRW
jgi:replication factor A1